MNRYQNPHVFEPLAMAYALGTLQGRARTRFETLQQQHFYLRVVTQAYEKQFASMTELLPAVNPRETVWQRVSAELQFAEHHKAVPNNIEAVKPKATRWQHWLPWFSVSFAAIVGAVMTVLLLNHAPMGYTAMLKSGDGGEHMMAVATATANESGMKVVVASLGNLLGMEDNDMVPTLWCFSAKKNAKPMRLGTLSREGSGHFSLDQKSWDGLTQAHSLAISLEPKGHSGAQGPLGKMLMKGELAMIEKR